MPDIAICLEAALAGIAGEPRSRHVLAENGKGGDVADEGTPDRRRRGIQSVEIGLTVLRTLASLGEPVPLGVLAQACDMPPPQAHRYLQSLIDMEMARQDAATGRYDLGPEALKLGLAALARMDAFRLVDSLISEHSRRTGQTVQIAALGPLGPTIVRWYTGRPAVMTSFNVGSVLPLLQSATGRVFLGFAPESETAELLARELADYDGSASEVASLRAEVIAAGCARVSGTMLPGLRATAFPIFDLQGRAALTATALARGGDPSADEQGATDTLAALCAEISRQLGWVV